MTLQIRAEDLGDADQLFALVTDFATSFQPERPAFQDALTEVLSDRSDS
jgi:hypothetical protein